MDPAKSGTDGAQNVKKTRWYYRLPGNFYGLGPTSDTYRTERDLRAMVRQAWGFKRLPQGFECWRA
jgi:hypothetical protein